MREVDTLEHVLGHLDRTSAGGLSGLSYGILRYVNPDVIKPLLKPFFGQCKFDYDRTVRLPDGSFSHYQIDTHALMISVRGCALNKTGQAFNPDGQLDHLRPICIGESLRRIAARCQLLQCEGSIGARLAASGQLGVGFERGTGTVYHLVSKALDALVKADIPCAMIDNDATNAYCSILRKSMQRGIAKHAPELLPAFDFLYAHKAFCFFYEPGARYPVYNFEVTDGVQQGDVFGPLFFSLALDELLVDLRKRMLDLKVDSTMAGSLVRISAEGAVGRAADGGLHPLPVGTNVKLVEAPSYANIDSQASIASWAAHATVTVEIDPAPGQELPAPPVRVTLPWESVRLKEHLFTLAYLDDLKLVCELHLVRPFVLAIRELGPRVGLKFENLVKNFIYVPRCFGATAAEMYPESVVVSDNSEGSSPKEKLKFGAQRLQGDPRKLLFTSCGVEKLMGAPLRVILNDVDAESDVIWLKSEVKKRADEAKRSFAYLGLSEVDAAAADQNTEGYTPAIAVQDANAPLAVPSPAIPEYEAQLQFCLLRYCLMSKLKHLAQYCPKSLVAERLCDMDVLAAAAVSQIMGHTVRSITPTQAKRILLPMRHSGFAVGCATAAPADFVSTVSKVEKQALRLASELETEGRLPRALGLLKDRIVNRAQLVEQGELTALEQELSNLVDKVEEGFRASARRGGTPAGNSRGGNVPLVPPALGPPEPLEPPAPDPPEPPDPPPPPPQPDVLFVGLHNTKRRSRAMAEGLYQKEWTEVYEQAPHQERASMDAAAAAGAGLFLSAIPMAEAFDMPACDFRRQLCRAIGLPTAPVPHVHRCGARGLVNLDAHSIRHICSCPCSGRTIATHNAVRDVLAHAIFNCGAAGSLPKAEVIMAPDGSRDSWHADVAFIHAVSGRHYFVDVTVVNFDADSYMARCRRPGDVERLLVAEEQAKRNQPVVRRILSERGNSKIFVPFVMSSAGGFGPEARKFLKGLYRDAREGGKFYLGVAHPVLQTTWNTIVAPNLWNQRLSVACTRTDAHYQGRIIANDLTATMVTDRRRSQPHRDPNRAGLVPRARAQL